MCDKPVDVEFRPFCSKRCANLDLGKWLTGSYAISSTEDDDEDGALPLSDGAFTDNEDDGPTHH